MCAVLWARVTGLLFDAGIRSSDLELHKEAEKRRHPPLCTHLQLHVVGLLGNRLGITAPRCQGYTQQCWFFVRVCVYANNSAICTWLMLTNVCLIFRLVWEYSAMTTAEKELGLWSLKHIHNVWSGNCWTGYQTKGSHCSANKMIYNLRVHYKNAEDQWGWIQKKYCHLFYPPCLTLREIILKFKDKIYPPFC